MPVKHYDIVVVGGGPAGNTVAAYLAKDGHKVVLLEKDKHPRHRIGESLLPSMMPVLKDFGLLDECERRGFSRKSGATYKWGKGDEPWHLKWKENKHLPYDYAYHVERASFDEMLSNHAKSVGVDVWEETQVLDPIFSDASKKRIVGVTYKKTNGETGELRGKFVVDCSGSASVVTRHISKRVYDENMRQVAFYTYFDDVAGPPEAPVEGNEDHIVITTCPKGWFWWIPIKSKEYGFVSVGLVSGQEFKDEFNKGEKGPENFFWDQVEKCPRVKEMLGKNHKVTQPFRVVKDWSYCSEVTAAQGVFSCGDSAAFLDPLISTGVSLAMLSAYSASICINSILKSPERELEIIGFYRDNYRQMYEVTRDFLHYFYAGATTMHKDELFWKGRQNLRMGDNVGAKQAFTYFTAIIPGNPHPAINKQVSFVKNMIKNVGLPDDAAGVEALKKQYDLGLKSVTRKSVKPSSVLIPNGEFKRSFRIEEGMRTLDEQWGIVYDKDRPVLSNTASWLMGQNFFVVEEEHAGLLRHLNGRRTWKEVITAAKKESSDFDADKTLKYLVDNALVLEKCAAKAKIAKVTSIAKAKKKKKRPTARKAA